jgi:hypothetical protein
VNTTATTEENMKKLNMGTDMNKDKHSSVMDEDGPVTMVSDLAKFKGPVALTISDWGEIFYAVEGRIAELRSDLENAVKVYARDVEERKAAGDDSGVEGDEGDFDSPAFLRKWLSQMKQIQATIGVDGLIGAARGVKAAPAKEVEASVFGHREPAAKVQAIKDAKATGRRRHLGLVKCE